MTLDAPFGNLERRLGRFERRVNGFLDEMRDQLQGLMDMFTRQSQSSMKKLTPNILENTERYASSFSSPPPSSNWNEYEKKVRRPKEATTQRLQREMLGDRCFSNVVEEFYKIKQDGSVREYEMRFEELKALMHNYNPYLTEDYFVLSFLIGLNPECRLVKGIQLKTVKQAADNARFHEFVFEEQRKEEEEKLKERANKEARCIDNFMEELEHESEMKERWNQERGEHRSENSAPSNRNDENCYEDGLFVAEISSNVVKVCSTDPKMCHHVAVNFEVEEQHQLKAEGLQVIAVASGRKQLNSMKALDEDVLTGFDIILDPQSMGTSYLNLVVITNPREMVCHSLEEDAAVIALIIIFVSADEYPRTKKKRPRKGMIKERSIKLERVGIG